MGRIKEIERKSHGRRKRKPVIYIICEGSETEIRYFKKFRSRECNIDIVPIPSQYKSADKLVQKSLATIGYNPYYPDEGDIVWCVFDRDDNSDAILMKAKQTAVKEGYKIAFSNPSFEIWFLLHFSNQTTPLENCESVVNQLKKKGKLEQYEKNKEVYEQLKSLQEVAIERAKKRMYELQEEHIEIISRESNPVTTVFELVEYLNSKK
ncbi:MAG: RloB family protein [Oscillospiraceae bacterium]|nr:RloB family protein [Oscillospiraceae bacterium]